jgi:hypothetical protein
LSFLVVEAAVVLGLRYLLDLALEDLAVVEAGYGMAQLTQLNCLQLLPYPLELLALVELILQPQLLEEQLLLEVLQMSLVEAQA